MTNTFDFSRYAHLYTSSPSGKCILRKYTGFDHNKTIPLCLSHGVDMNHEKNAQDVTGAEPIHWSYNKDIYIRSRHIKPSLTIPHPWLLMSLAERWKSPPSNGKALVIGPPPSKSNDIGLLRSLRRTKYDNVDLLLKHRNDEKTQRSRNFWEKNGIRVVTASSRDDEFYQRLFQIMGGYEYVISPFLSSATFFAAALGLKIIIIDDYSYCTYATPTIDFSAFEKNEVAKQAIYLFSDFVRSRAAREYSEGLLGIDLPFDPNQIKANLKEAMDQLNYPIFVPIANGSITVAKIYGEVARATGRKDFLKHGIVQTARRALVGLSPEIVWKKTNIIDIVRNGISQQNFQSRPIRTDEIGAKLGEGAEDI